MFKEGKNCKAQYNLKFNNRRETIKLCVEATNAIIDHKCTKALRYNAN